MNQSAPDFFPAAAWNVPPPAERYNSLGSNEWYSYRSRFSLVDADGAAASRKIRVAADSKYWLYVNGKLVVAEGGLKRGPVPNGSYYDEVEIADFLKEGENTIAVLLWFFGRHGFSHRNSGMPGLLVDVGTEQILRWKVQRHPAYFDAGYVADAYRLSENSVGFNAGLELEGWSNEEFDDSAWADSLYVGPAGCAPWGLLEKREFGQWFWSDLKDYESIHERRPAGKAEIRQFYCRFPHNCHFVPYLEIEADPGLQIDIVPDLNTNCLRSSYITKAGRQSFESPGWMSGEAVIYYIPSDGVHVIGLRYRETGFPSKFTGTFNCDHEGLNRLWEKARRTLYVTMRDTFMDCPCRERAQWPGDMVVQLGQVPFCLGREADLLVKKAVREMFRWQRNDGILYGPVPEGNWRMELPAQMLSVLSQYGAWTYYMHSGDRRTLEEIYPRAKRYLDIWEFQENGLIDYRPAKKGAAPVMVDGLEQGTWDWIDWGHRIDAEPSLNSWYVLAAKGVRMMAEELGFLADAEAIGAREDQVRSAIRDVYWNTSRGGFVSPNFEFDPDERVQALAVLCGAAKEEHFPRLLELFETVEQACPYMEKYVIEAMFAMGEAEAALRRMERRYRSMVADEGTTLWEQWPHQFDQTGTINHSWSGGPLTILSGFVAGIRPVEGGWSRFIVQPRPGKLSHIRCSVAIPQGSVELDASLTRSTWDVSLAVPEGTVASVDLSGFDPAFETIDVAGDSSRWKFAIAASMGKRESAIYV